MHPSLRAHATSEDRKGPKEEAPSGCSRRASGTLRRVEDSGVQGDCDMLTQTGDEKNHSGEPEDDPLTYKGVTLQTCQDGDTVIYEANNDGLTPKVRVALSSTHQGASATIQASLERSTITLKTNVPDSVRLPDVLEPAVKLRLLGKDLNRTLLSHQRDLWITTPDDMDWGTGLPDNQGLATMLWMLDCSLRFHIDHIPDDALRLMYDGTYMDLAQVMSEDNRARKRLTTTARVIETMGVTDQGRIREVIHARARTQSNNRNGTPTLFVFERAVRLIAKDEPILWLMRDAPDSVYQMIMATHGRMMQGFTGWLVSIIMINWAVDLVLGRGELTPKRLAYEATVGWQDWLDSTHWGSQLGWDSRIHGDPTPERVTCRLLTYLGVPEGTARTISVSDDLCPVLSAVIESIQ